MTTRQYFLANNIPGQPFADIRCYIADDQGGGEYVLIRCADLRLGTCPESIAKRSNLTPCGDDRAPVLYAKGGLVGFEG